MRYLPMLALFVAAISLAFLGYPLMSTSSGASKEQVASDITISSTVKSAWLRERLPDDALFYARIPPLWSSLSYSQDSFKYALGNSQHTELIEQLQKASKDWLQQADPELIPLLNLLAGQLDGPLEVAVLPSAPMPQILLSASLNLQQPQLLTAIIDSLSEAGIVKNEVRALSNGQGVLFTELGSTPYRWDNESKRLDILLRLGGADLEALDTVFNNLTLNPGSPMLDNEQQMDASTKGLYFWFNNQLAYAFYQPLLAAGNSWLNDFAIAEIRTLALSWGVRNKKGRLKIQVDAPHSNSLRQILPVAGNHLDLATAGTPVFSLLLNIPTLKQLQQSNDQLQRLGLENDILTALRSQLFATANIELPALLAAIGPEALLISDDAGEYLAVKIRDRNVLRTLEASLDDTNKIAAKTSGINHLKLANPLTMNSKKGIGLPFYLDGLLRNVGSHFYWQVDKDYLIIASLAQILKDRQQLLSQQNISQWFIQDQRQDLSNSIAALSLSIDQAPKRIYYGYISALQLLADITKAEIDTTTLPSASDLALPQRGTFGLQLDSSDSFSALELTFEATPMDVLLVAKGLSSIAAIAGVTTLLAPTYQTFEFRDITNRASDAATNAKLRLLGFYIEHQRFPNDTEISAVSAGFKNTADYRFTLAADSGLISVTFKGPYQISGDRLEFLPSVSNGEINWKCSSSLRRKYRPSGCDTYTR